MNLIHEIFRQAFLLNFSWAMAIRRTIAVYKDWIQLSVCRLKTILNMQYNNLNTLIIGVQTASFYVRTRIITNY